MVGSDTKQRILDTAERLFADRGFAGTSLRAITREADVNQAAVHYHYGSKDELLKAVLNRLIVPMNEERLRLLDEATAAADPEPPTVDAILEAFLGPDLRLFERLSSKGPEVPRFISRSYIEGSPMMQELMDEQFSEAGRRFTSALQDALPHLSADEIGWRMRFVVGVVIYLFAGIESPNLPPLVDLDDLEGTLKRVIAFVAPGLAAHPITETAAAIGEKVYGAPPTR